MKSTSLRKAFQQAALGRQKSIASEAFPDRSVEAAEVEVTRILGDRADRRPTFTLLAEVLDGGNPEPVLAWIAGVCGVRWERLPEPEATSLARIEEHVGQIELALADVRDELRKRKPPIRVETARREKRGAA